MKSLLLSVLLVFTLTSCNKQRCKQMSVFVADQLAAHMECSNKEAIYDSITPSSCKVPESNDMSAFPLCSLVLNVAMEIANQSIPAKWECKKDLFSPEVKQAVSAICLLL